MCQEDFEERYQRQLLLPEIGCSGQRRLASKCVAVIGAGGLASSLLPLLVGAGVGELRLYDGDRVSLSNLSRQTLYEQCDVGQPKALLAAERLRRRNPHCRVRAEALYLDERNCFQLLDGVDLIIDATDNERTRRLLDAYAQAAQCPWLYVSVEAWRGQIALFDVGTPSYAALFPAATEPLELAPVPVLGSTPALLGALAASEALKYLLGLPSPLRRGLLLVDSLSLDFQYVQR